MVRAYSRFKNSPAWLHVYTRKLVLILLTSLVKLLRTIPPNCSTMGRASLCDIYYCQVCSSYM